ncbi:MAG: hypothetical protein AAGH45_01210 [Pseudomonadota bacterium]
MVIRLGLLLTVVLGLVAVPGAFAQGPKVTPVSVDTSEGFGRLLFDLPVGTTASASLSNTVLVIRFSAPVAIDTQRLALSTSRFVALVRQDPNGQSLRLALSQPLDLTTSRDGQLFAVDLLPRSFNGPIPTLIPAPKPPADPQPEPEPEAPSDASALEALAAAEEAAMALLEAGEAPSQPGADMADKAPPALEQQPFEGTIEPLPIQVSANDYFTRVLFRWPEKVTYAVKSQPGSLTVHFDRPARPRLAPLRVDPPLPILGAVAQNERDGLSVTLTLGPGTVHRHHQDGDGVIIDLISGDAALALDATDTKDSEGYTDGKNSDGKPDKAEGAADHSDLGDHKKGAQDEHPGDHPKDKKAAGKKDERHSGLEVPDVADLQDTAGGDAPDPDSRPVDGLASLVGETPDLVSPLPNADGDASESPAKAPDPPVVRGMPVGDSGEPVVVTLTQATEGITLDFPVGPTVPAAIFKRAGYVWLAFDALRPIDLSAINPNNLFELKAAEVTAHPNLSLVRLEPLENVLVSAVPSEQGWTLTLGEILLGVPKSLTMRKIRDTENGNRVEIPFPGLSGIHRVRDPEIGDEMFIVTGIPPARGLAKTRRLAEFETLVSLHGLAVDPLRDDLLVNRVAEKVVIGTREGLFISESDVCVAGSSLRKSTNGGSPAFIDYAAWLGDPEASFLLEEQRLLGKLASAAPDFADPRRIDLARYYIANGLHAEASGVLKSVDAGRGLLGSDPHVLALKSHAAFGQGRYGDAADGFAQRGLHDDPHAALWRSLVYAKLRRWDDAISAFKVGSEVMDLYPEIWQHRFLLAASRSALAAGDQALAETYLKAVPVRRQWDAVQQERRLLEGQLLEMLDEKATAYDYFLQVERQGRPDLAAEARLERLRLGQMLGRVVGEALIDELESLRFQWRGDDLEIDINRALGEAYCATRNYRACLHTFDRVQGHFPNHPRSRDLWRESVSVFRDLFLHGAADDLPPVDALALFYEFKSLTPIGQDGDQMIRQLANRLIDVDLLSQAATLLDHQVNNRLRGVARAQIAATLASVYLMDRDPQKALQSLQETRQARLPSDLRDRRLLLEARALAALGRHDHAIEVLDGEESEEARSLRAEVHWSAQDWGKAGDAYELLADEAWREARPVPEKGRRHALRTAIAFSLAGEQERLARIRLKYLAEMSESLDAQAFRVVTEPLEKQDLAYLEQARRVAQVDLLQSFLDEFKANRAALTTPVTN